MKSLWDVSPLGLWICDYCYFLSLYPFACGGEDLDGGEEVLFENRCGNIDNIGVNIAIVAILESLILNWL